MMFLVIFASLAAAMAIVSQGNLRTADSHLKMNRALAAAETGVQFLIYRIDEAAKQVKTSKGIIDHSLAQNLWPLVADELADELGGDIQYAGLNLYVDGDVLHVPAVPISPGDNPTFEATLQPHPIPGEDYDGQYYDRPPYSTMGVSNAHPLDATWIRVKVTGADGPEGHRLFRTITIDFKMDKKIRYAILAKSRIMVGRNVLIEGAIGSRFMDVHLPNGHPVQVESDFRGLDSNTGSDGLDARLDMLTETLKTNDQDGDNRLHIYNALETDGISNPASLDLNGDGYIDDYDFFLEAFDADGNKQVSMFELENQAVSATAAQQLMELIDTFGASNRVGFGDNVIDNNDRYAKIHGQIDITAAMDDWENGAAGGPYQEYLQGAIKPDHNQDALTFESDNQETYDFEAEDFDTGSYESMASNDLSTQASPESTTVVEEVPYGSAHPYDFYERPVYRNKTFENVRIPQGTNALFIDCVFKGVTYVQSDINNFIPHPTDPSINAFNYCGIWEDSTGTPKHPDIDAYFQQLYPGLTSTKDMGNNIRFHNCVFQGAIVSSTPQDFSHIRNKLTFTGTTRFDLDAVTDPDDKKLFQRSTLLTPNFSIEMGTFQDPQDAGETVQLSGTIVAGVLDMRGQVKINGTILTTFLPQANTSPVLGDTSPNFNTTLGYFPSSSGDLEAELPANGMGVIQVRYDPTLPLPDGILGPIELKADYATYFEGEGQ